MKKMTPLNLPSLLQTSPPPPPPPAPLFLSNKLSPSLLIIVVLLALIFFSTGIFHLLLRHLLRRTPTEPEDPHTPTSPFQGQLRHLFHLHDAGVDQSFIDTLPVFLYKAITGLKDPFDCAVCLSEFEAEDKLRLLPKCSHAFHLHCIDTWLLSHSTCPLCRRNLLLLEASPCSSPASESSGNQIEIEVEEMKQKGDGEVKEEKVVAVKLGKFRSVDNNGGEGTSSNRISIDGVKLDQRRCYSMGSYEYVMDESSLLQVAIKADKKNLGARRAAVAAESFEFNGGSVGGGLGKKESFSISKIWMREKNNRVVRHG